MRKKKAIRTEAATQHRDSPPRVDLRVMLRWDLLALAVIATGSAGVVGCWAMGQWLPGTTRVVAESPLRLESPDAVSQRMIASYPQETREKMSGWKDLIKANFAGDRACAECHPSEYEAHQRSGHSHTAMLMNESPLADELSMRRTYEDPQRDQVFEFIQTQGQFLVRDVEHPPEVSLPVTWLLGSGVHAQTPIAVDEATQRGVELRWSSFPRNNRVGLTPDHQRFGDFANDTLACFGRPMEAADIRSCLGCHSTVITPPDLPIINSMIIENVGCERCHGPRKKHVELAHQGRAEEIKPMLQYENAADYMAACATCHRDASSITPDIEPHVLPRFQPYGIQRSRCYLETPGNLTCSTCHDPHDAVSHDRKRSVEQCNSCHHDGASTTCTHQPRGDCIECHMPLVPWSSGIAFHDHWIRIPEGTPVADPKRSQ